MLDRVGGGVNARIDGALESALWGGIAVAAAGAGISFLLIALFLWLAARYGPLTACVALGTIFAAADPFYPILFHQLLIRKGYKVRVWVKSAQIEYILPGRHDLYFSISIEEPYLDEIEKALKADEKHIKAYPIEMHDKNGELCVSVAAEIYIRNLYPTEINNSVSI